MQQVLVAFLQRIDTTFPAVISDSVFRNGLVFTQLYWCRGQSPWQDISIQIVMYVHCVFSYHLGLQSVAQPGREVLMIRRPLLNFGVPVFVIGAVFSLFDNNAFADGFFDFGGDRGRGHEHRGGHGHNGGSHSGGGGSSAGGSVPEIDGNSAACALALLIGGAFLLKDRFHGRQIENS